MKPHRRLPGETVDFTLGADEENGFSGHPFTVCIARDPETGGVAELNFVGRGKIGHGLDLLFHELGIKVSRAIQARDPETGEDRS